MDIKIPLDLSKHCVETEIRRQYNQLISRYIKQKTQDTQLEEHIQALQNALIHLDFAQLRSSFGGLTGNTDQRVDLIINSDQMYQILINKEKVYEIQIQEITD